MYNINKQFKSSVIIGINGLDCSGKTYFAKYLKNYFTDRGISTSVVNIDLYNVKTIENHTYTSSSKQITNKNLEIYYNQIIDFNLAHKKILELIDNCSVIIIEGIFIYKKELLDLFDLKVFLTVNHSIAIERFRLRQERNNDIRPISIFKKIWIPSHIRYLEEVKPEQLSDIVIDNSNYAEPQIVRHSIQ